MPPGAHPGIQAEQRPSLSGFVDPSSPALSKDLTPETLSSPLKVSALPVWPSQSPTGLLAHRSFLPHCPITWGEPPSFRKGQSTLSPSSSLKQKRFLAPHPPPVGTIRSPDLLDSTRGLGRKWSAFPWCLLHEDPRGRRTPRMWVCPHSSPSHVSEDLRCLEGHMVTPSLGLP